MARVTYKLTVTDSFSAAHAICGYPGKCSNLHGHNWVVEVTVSGNELDSLGMLVDLRLLKEALRRVIDGLDHRYLNDITETTEINNPTSENIALFIAREFESEMINSGVPEGITLSRVSICEGPKSQVSLEFEH